MTKTTTDSSQVIVVNPEYASLVPKISDSQYKEIKQDIQEHGQHVPIIINQKGEILDGLTRNRICQELEIEPRTILSSSEYEDPLLAKQFIININRNRRPLDTFQRIELECKYETIRSELAKKRMLADMKVSDDSSKDEDAVVQNYIREKRTITSKRADIEQNKKGLVDPFTEDCV
jgi:hypothetical protein